MSAILPAGFEQLEPFLGLALSTERERHAAISRASMAEVKAFYDAMLPILPQALDHLNRHPLDAMPTAERRLLDLCLSMSEAAMAIEMFDEVNPPYLMPVSRFEPVHDTWTDD
jgi:hypothetical protein